MPLTNLLCHTQVLLRLSEPPGPLSKSKRPPAKMPEESVKLLNIEWYAMIVRENSLWWAIPAEGESKVLLGIISQGLF